METLYSEIVVAGCGNPLYADDGFGPAVVESLKDLELPENVTVVDAGLGGPHFVFTLLNPESTKTLIIVDIADFGGEPGELRWLAVDELPVGSYRDAHSWDLTEPLQSSRTISGSGSLHARRSTFLPPIWSSGLQTRYREPFPELYPRY